jgi:predicted metal-dependent hydrolase
VSEILVRRLSFRFDRDISFQWNRGNPSCGNVFNVITFVGPAFERYFVRAVGAALPRIQDERTRREATLFCQQEGQHAKQHVAHLKLLNERYPGLDRVQQEIMNSYDALLDGNSLEFNLAYMASLELMFTPFAIYAVRNVETLFGDSDPRIASFMLWHMVEEFEHRSCASDIYDDVVGDHWFRIKSFPAVARHLLEVGHIASEGIRRCVPASENRIPHDSLRGVLRGTRGRMALLWGLLDTLRPGHVPDAAPEPPWIRRWFEDSAGGEIDMTLYYPKTS